DSQGQFAALFAAARADADPASAERCAHTLRGTAGNIGARAVQEAATDLEQACQAKAPAEQIDALLNKVLAALDPVMIGLRELEQTSTTALHDVPAVDKLELATACDQLLALLQNDDGAAVQLWHDKEQLFQAAFGQHSAAIAAHMQDFDLDAALAMVQQATQNHTVHQTDGK
ncbi:MAG: hypothetical protein RL300_350, partial [Pseudomonadota bacterium]